MPKQIPALILIVFLAGSCKQKGWPAADRKSFLTTCTEASKKGMDEAKANTYCDCMQKKLEARYPNINEAEKLSEHDLQSESWMKEVNDCLK